MGVGAGGASFRTGFKREYLRCFQLFMGNTSIFGQEIILAIPEHSLHGVALYLSHITIVNVHILDSSSAPGV